MKKSKFKLLLILIACAALIFSFPPDQVKAANDQDLVQASGGPVYLIEGTMKRQIKDNDTLANLCWSGIKQISRSELNNHPAGPNFTRIVRYGPHVYLLQNCQKRHVLSIQALDWNGFSLSDLRDINTNTFNHWSQGSDLSAPKLMRAPGSSTVYFIDSGVRRAVKDGATFGHWRFDANNIATNKSVLDYPQGVDLTRVVLFNNNVYAVDSGTFRYAGDENILNLNGYDMKDLAAVGSDAASYLSIGAFLGIPRVMLDESTGTKYLVDNNELRRIVSDHAFNEWGLTSGDITKVAKRVNKIPVGDLDRLSKDAGGIYWLAWRGSKRQFPGSNNVSDYGYSTSNATPVSNEFLRGIRQGEELDGGIESLDGYTIPATSGKTAREQHLYLSTEEEALGRTDASAAVHYSRSGTPSESQNSMAGGYGAFGSGVSPASTDQERYYINMRWSYVDWYEDCDSRDSSGNCTTRTRNLNYTAKNWHRHKKVIITNPANGRRLIASVEEAGPAIWTGRVSGLSPEAMAELGASTNDTLNYKWAANQGISLGRLY